ncbi:MAG: IS1595 family transposase [Candidatus Korobacteraceae bacterium]|jgi:transposase-like protein
MTLPELNRSFSTDEDCREILTKLRWPEGVECPRCHNRNVWWVQSRKQFTCSECSYQFSVTTGTIFKDSHLPLPIWFMAVLLLCEAKKGMSAHQLKRTIWGLHKGSYKTAWYLCHRIRAAMAQVDRPMLDGVVEMDETYVGGKQRGSQRKAGFGDSNKQIVIGIRQRGGALRFFHAEDAKSGTLAKYIQENISQDVDVIVTDEYRPYLKAVGNARHETVNHRAKEYVRLGTDIHTNTAENAFSLLKRGIMGTWHRLSAKHLQAYLDEMSFRFDRRGRPDLFIDTLRHMVTANPMTFEDLTAA